MGLFLLKCIGVIFTFFWFLSFTDPAEDPWIFKILPFQESLGEWLKWLEVEHTPIYWLVACFLVPIVFLYSILPLFILGWIWSL